MIEFNQQISNYLKMLVKGGEKMSVMEEVLLEEYDRSIRISTALEEEIKNLPKGSLQKKVINGKEYWYLQYRENDSIKSDYVKIDNLERIKNDIAKRKSDIVALREQKKSQRMIEKALGKEFINEHSAD